MAGNFTQSIDQMSSIKTQTEVPMCTVHYGERQYFYCITCNVAICHNCRLNQHSRSEHEIRGWKEVMEAEEKRRIRQQELGDVESKLKSAKAKAEQDVNIHAQQLFAEVETWKMKMKKDIEATYQKRARILQQKQTELDWSSRPEWNRSVTSGMNELSIQQDAHVELAHEITALYLEPGQPKLTSFGEIRTSGRSNRTQTTSENKNLELTFLTEFGNHAAVKSIAAYQSNLIAVVNNNHYYGCNSVTIYGNYNGKYVKQSRVEIKYGVSVAISAKGKVLVHSDVNDNDVIKIFSSTGGYERSWPVNRHFTVNVIAITPDDKVVIGSRSNKTITIHHLDGRLIRRHSAECDHIASNGKQIAYTPSGLDSVCVIDFVTGQILWVVNFPNPHNICYEHKSNTLLVAGKAIARRLGRENQSQAIVKQYCSTTGRLISHVTFDMDTFPLIWRMTTTHDNKLILAYEKTIKIYDIN